MYVAPVTLTATCTHLSGSIISGGVCWCHHSLPVC